MTGRPRNFDEEEALTRAMQVFWRLGYERAGLTELLAAMQISRQSCYNTFGDKRALFLRAIGHYADEAILSVRDELRRGTSPLNAVQRWLEKAAEQACAASPGCLVINSIVEFGNRDRTVKRTLVRLVSQIEQEVAGTLARAKEQGELSDSAKPEELAAFITHVRFGFAAVGKIKMCKESSAAIVSVAMRSLRQS